MGTNYNHDIGPGEERGFNQGIQGYGMVPIEVISNFYEGEDGMEVEYERMYVQRPMGGIFHEPMDRPPSAPLMQRPTTAHRKLYHERERLATFENHWSEEYPVRPRDLARNGLYFVGPGDKVKCAFCQRTLRGWEADDVVEEEHRRIYPDCPFVLGRCDGTNVGINTPESMQQSYGVRVKGEATQETMSHMQDMSQRLKTFDHRWPSDVPVEPRLIAEAGLFYIGVKDKTRCFLCNKVIQGWEEGNDPWKEHARLYPQCPYILAVKGREFVEQASARSSTNGSSQPIQPPSQTQLGGASGAATGSASHPVQASQLPAPCQVSEIPNVTEQMNQLQIDEDMNSVAVKAFCEMFEDVPVDEIRQLIENIRLSKGSSYKLMSADLEPLVQDK